MLVASYMRFEIKDEHLKHYLLASNIATSSDKYMDGTSLLQTIFDTLFSWYEMMPYQQRNTFHNFSLAGWSNNTRKEYNQTKVMHYSIRKLS